MDIIKRRKELFNIVKSMCVESKRKKLANINVSSVFTSFK